MDDESRLSVYNKELMDLSGQVEFPKHLQQPYVAAKAVSPICGSKVTIELTLHDGRVSGFGYEVEACALTKSVIAVMSTAILGKTRQDIARAGEELRAMLADDAPPPTGDWSGLKILQPASGYKARHNAIMLPFEAVEKAFTIKPPLPKV